VTYSPHGGAVGSGFTLKTERARVPFVTVSLKFFIDRIEYQVMAAERNDQCGNQHYSRELLMMGIVVPETC